MKLHDDAIQTFSNVRFVPFAVVNMISMGRWHYKGTNMLVQSGDAKCTRGDTWCCEDSKIKVTFAIWMIKSWRGTMIANWRRKWSFLMLWKCWKILSLEGKFVYFQINWRIFFFWLEGENCRVSSQR